MNETCERLICGFLVDLAIILLIVGLRFHIIPLTVIGICGLVLASSPGLIAGPLAPVVAIYIAIQPLCVLAEYLVERHKQRK